MSIFDFPWYWRSILISCPPKSLVCKDKKATFEKLWDGAMSTFFIWATSVFYDLTCTGKDTSHTYTSVWKFTFLHVWAAELWCSSFQKYLFYILPIRNVANIYANGTTEQWASNICFVPKQSTFSLSNKLSPNLKILWVGEFKNFGQWQMKFVIFPLKGRTCGLGSPIKTCLQPMFIKWIRNQYE